MTTPPKPRGKKLFSRPLSEIVNRALDPLAAKQGFGEASLLLRWEEIAGARIAALCQPIRLQWPARGKQRPPGKPQEAATLALRVEPGFGLDIQHMSAALIDRVNQHLGWRCVVKLTIKQEPLRRKAAPARRRPPGDAAARAKAAEAAQGVTDEGLRRALIALGERAMAKPISRD